MFCAFHGFGGLKIKKGLVNQDKTLLREHYMKMKNYFKTLHGKDTVSTGMHKRNVVNQGKTVVIDH